MSDDIINQWEKDHGIEFFRRVPRGTSQALVSARQILDLARRVAKREREQWRSLVESLSDVASAAMKSQQWALTVRKRWHEAMEQAAAIRGTNERKESR